jgi:protein-tyrosine phosphatase
MMRRSAVLAGALLLALAPAGPLVGMLSAKVAAPAHLRVLPLEGGNNFRDMGGYRTADGKHVRWNMLYRSGAMWKLTAADYAYLDKLGIAVVCDLRSGSERKAQPTMWGGTNKPIYWTRDYDLSVGQLSKLFAPGSKPTAADGRAAMIALYADLPFAQADGYREMFRNLVAGKVPLAFNCSAGKDRTGVGAALILSALGVPRKTIDEDYLLSNATFDPTKLGPLGSFPPDVVAAILRVDPAYLDAAFGAIVKRYGSVPAYLKAELGVGPAEIAQMRRTLLE